MSNVGRTGPAAGLGVPSNGCASIEAMLEERRIRTRTPEWRGIYDRIQVAMELTSRLNVLRFGDIDSRKALPTIRRNAEARRRARATDV
jgi:hypothetical protein